MSVLQDPESTLPTLLHDEGITDNMESASNNIPTPVAQHGMICDDRYEKYKYEKYDPSAMDFHASQRYLAGDMNIAAQGQLLAPSIGLHGLKADPTAYALASHPFSIQRLLPGAADAKADVKMFDMTPYSGYTTLAPTTSGK